MQRYTILAEFKKNFSSVVYQYVKERDGFCYRVPTRGTPTVIALLLRRR